MASKEPSDERYAGVAAFAGKEREGAGGMAAGASRGGDAGLGPWPGDRGGADQAAAGRASPWRPLPSTLGMSAWDRQQVAPPAPVPAQGQRQPSRLPPGAAAPGSAVPQAAEPPPPQEAAQPLASSSGAQWRASTPFWAPAPSAPAPVPTPGPGMWPPPPSRSASTQFLPRAEHEGPLGASPAAAFGAAPTPPTGAAAADFADEATEVYGDEGSAEPHQVKGRLAVLDGELAGHWFTLLGSEIRIGRADDNHLIVPDLAVSRHHVRLIYSQGAYRLQDMRSGNGTFVNGIHVDEATLRDGDQIEIGRTIMEFLASDRAPGPVRFRRNLLQPGAAMAPQGLPAAAAAQRPMLPPAAAPQPQPYLPPTQAMPPVAAPPAQVARSPQGTPMPWAPPAAPLRTQPPPPRATPMPAMGFPAPDQAAAAAARARREVTPVSMKAQRGIPGWAIITFSVFGVAIVGLVALVLYRVLVGFGPPEPTPFDRANAAYAAGRWEEALTLMKAVPPDAEHAADAQRAIQVLTTNKKLFDEARELRGNDNLEEAVARLRKVPEGEPYSSESADLLAEIEAEIEAREAAKPKGPKLDPGSPLDKALEPYRKERLAEAQQKLSKLAKTDPQAKELAPKLDEFIKELRIGRALLQQKKPEEAAGHLERALTLDIELGGALQEKIAPQYVDIVVGLIDQHLAERKLEQAGELMQRLRQASPPDNPKVVALNESMSARARQLLVEAIQLRDATPRRAKTNLKAVLLMVPPSDPSYVKAKAELAK